MLPPDVASSLRLVLPDQQAATNAQTQPVASGQKIADVLSNLVPGQRILAEIQALLPNGSYRAVVAQRDVTLALPFSAKAGDTLELEVTESDGKLALAFVANRSETAAKPVQESVATTISPTGKLIGDLMGGIDGEGKRAPPAPLNGSQPLVESMPKTAADLAPILKQALTQSGMFYEAHQARWVAGELPTDALKNEPQGKFSALQTPVAGDAANAKTGTTATAETLTASAPSATGRSETASGNPVPRELAPLVHQQLDGLATQNFAWQGQVWPGQQMRWEIGEDLNDSHTKGDQEALRWQTRIKLALPRLGDIEVALNLRAGGEVSITLTADSDTSEASLRDGTQQLRRQFEAAGLNLTNLVVLHGEAAE
ncbi:MAG: flagellar hook-length control protein FliK [Dechloromonas sp.]|nr:flagellar hook-length control protein FliK [Dechloromonas sp.]